MHRRRFLGNLNRLPTHLLRPGFFLGVAFLALPGPAALHAENAPDGAEFFEKRIRPLLVERCYKCHSQQSETLKGELWLDSAAGLAKGGAHGPVIVPGDPSKSRLIEAVSYENPDLQMPPKEKLAPSQIADLVQWVKKGAPDPRFSATGTHSTPKAGVVKDFWSFHPPQLPAIPKIKLRPWPQTPVDHFILARLESNGLAPAPPATKYQLIRRATYDLTGLPPTAEEVEAFLGDSGRDAFTRLVNRLLDSPRYGERWGRFWLDLARYSDTKGYVYDREERRFVHSTSYRDWVIRAFNEDMPYDQFLRWQLAGDRLLPQSDPAAPASENLAAMGFLTLGRRFLGVTHDIIDDRIDVVTRTTMGLTASCARCHDHKFDPIPTRDYYSLYGIFNGSREKLVPLPRPSNASPALDEFYRGLKERETKLDQTFAAKCAEASARLRGRVSEYLEALLEVEKLPSEEFYTIMAADDLNPVIARQWQSYLYQRRERFDPVFAPWTAFSALPERNFEQEAPTVWASLEKNSPRPLNPLVAGLFSGRAPTTMHQVAQRYGKLFAALDQKVREYLKAGGGGLASQQTPEAGSGLTAPEEELRQVLYGPESPVNIPSGPIVDVEWFFDENSRVELAKLQAEIERWIIASPAAPAYAVILEDRPAQKNGRVFIRGNPSHKGDEVPRLFLPSFPAASPPAVKNGSGRLEMAEAITGTNNPLTARVLVNRVWLHHFGAGLVKTPSDFGTRSEAPSHPELLDYLAVRFMADGWSMKKLHRLIMLSAVYQQSSGEEARPGPLAGENGPREKKGVAPPRGRLTRPPPQANPATGIAPGTDPENLLLGRMNRIRLDFEAFRDALLAVTGELDLAEGGKPVDLFSRPYATRRTVYGLVDRQFLPGILRTFDFANPDVHSPKRHDTTVPQQALFLMNHPFILDRARALSARADTPCPSTPEEKIARLYRRVYQRAPSPAELAAGLAFIEKSGPSGPAAPVEAAKPIWQYGYGEFDPQTGRLIHFEPLPHFTGAAWQASKAWPDPKFGSLQLKADGGHPGNDRAQAAVRRWTAERPATIAIKGRLSHDAAEGDGVEARIVSSGKGLLGSWKARHSAVPTDVERVEVAAGETIDFVVDCLDDFHHDAFSWAPHLSAVADPELLEWDAKNDFDGPPEPGGPLGPWEKYAQVLLLSNEFLFID